MKLVEVTNRKQINSLVQSGLQNDLGVGFINAMKLYLSDDRSLDDLWVIYMMYHKNKPAGVCGLYNNKVGKRDELWVGWFGIYPKYRGRGLGSKMMTELKKRAISNGAETLLLYCNQDKVPFYESNDFTLVTDHRTINRFIRECQQQEEFARKRWNGAIMRHSFLSA